jgi:hypothetical protein
MKLITELNEEIQFIAEDHASNPGLKHYYIKGIFLQGNLRNRNGRRYPMSILEQEVNRYTNTYVINNRALGELGHPDGPTINLDRVSHLITELYKDGDNFIGKARILSTKHGKEVKALIDEGVKLGVSSRGMGSLKSVGDAEEVQGDFYLATAADIVADPSAPDAFVRGIMEGKEWIMDSGVFKPVQIEEVKKQIQTKSFKKGIGKRVISESEAVKAFAQFLENI